MFYGKGGFLKGRSEGCLEDSEKRDIGWNGMREF